MAEAKPGEKVTDSDRCCRSEWKTDNHNNFNRTNEVNERLRSDTCLSVRNESITVWRRPLHILSSKQTGIASCRYNSSRLLWSRHCTQSTHAFAYMRSLLIRRTNKGPLSVDLIINKRINTHTRTRNDVNRIEWMAEAGRTCSSVCSTSCSWKCLILWNFSWDDFRVELHFPFLPYLFSSNSQPDLLK